MLLEKLREHCHESHRLLHVHPLLAPLQGEINSPQFHAIIAMFYAAYEASEAMKPNSDFPDSPVMQWLSRDMAHHQITPLDWNAAALPLDTESKLAGYLYVKQGSTLGGQFISHLLHETLGLEGGKSNHFFYGYGTQTGEKWRKFKERLTNKQAQLDHIAVLDSAERTFETIRVSADRMLRMLA